MGVRLRVGLGNGACAVRSVWGSVALMCGMCRIMLTVEVGLRLGSPTRRRYRRLRGLRWGSRLSMLLRGSHGSLAMHNLRMALVRAVVRLRHCL